MRPITLTVRTPNLLKARRAPILTAPDVDSHNSFEHPHAVEPAPFAGRVVDGALSFDLPPKSIAVVQVQ